MKLHRFVALDNHRAISMAHETLGPDALVYSTRGVPAGIEVLAGLPETEASTVDVPMDNVNVDREMIVKLNSQLRLMEESIEKLSAHVVVLSKAMSEGFNKKKQIRWAIFKNIGFLTKLKKFKKPLTEGIYGRQATH